jgi:GDP-L-fucose synthase
VADFFAEEKPDYVFLAAAKVGGIHANNVYRGEFLYDNLMIQNNVIHQSHSTGSKSCSSWVRRAFTRSWRPSP